MPPDRSRRIDGHFYPLAPKNAWDLSIPSEHFGKTFGLPNSIKEDFLTTDQQTGRSPAHESEKQYPNENRRFYYGCVVSVRRGGDGIGAAGE